jgi:hypothetical protein
MINLMVPMLICDLKTCKYAVLSSKLVPLIVKLFFFYRFGQCVSVSFTSFSMACNFEYILWYIETLHGFPYNYQILYSSYIAIGALAEAIARLWMQRKRFYDHVSC